MKKLLSAALLAGVSAHVSAQTPGYQPWTEQWPATSVIVSENFVSEYLRATFGKIGAVAANQLNDLLNKPSTQLKVATEVGDWIRQLNADPVLTPDEKARQFLGVAEFDFGSYASNPSGTRQIVAQFSPSLSVSRLTWNRHIARINCQRQVNGNLVTESWDVEARYMIYRNNKLLAQIGEQVAVRPLAGAGVSFAWSESQGWRLRGSVESPNPVDTTTKAGPFFDFDPYNLPVGTPVIYTIRSSISGCGPNTMAPGLGAQYSESTLTFDGDGNAQPDFYPAAELATKRSHGLTMGTQMPGTWPFRDASQKIKVVMFEREASIASSVHKDFRIRVPPEYVVIGGGVHAWASGAYGHYITASYPSSDFSSWIVSTKDHYYQNPSRITAFALAMKIEGRSREQLIQDLVIASSTSPSMSQPDATASVPSGYVMIGGGFRIDWTGMGVLGTASYPSSATTWRAQGKDHIYPQSAPVTAFAVGLRNYIPGVGTVVALNQGIQSAYDRIPQARLEIAAGYAPTACGAKVNWSGYGSLLWLMRPWYGGSGATCSGAGKEHHSPSSATIDVHSIGIAVIP
jgi:hypothetical protein